MFADRRILEEERDSLERQLRQHRKNLARLEERAAKYTIDVPISLLNEIDEVKERIERDKARLQEILTKLEQTPPEEPGARLVRPEVGKKRISPRAALLAASGLVVGLAVVGWAVSTSFHRGEPPEPWLTCQPSATPARVGVAQLPNCPHGFQTRLIDLWMNEAEVISLDGAFQTSTEARAQSGFDIVVWGSCDEQESETVVLNYELTTTRKPDEVYEPSNLSATGSLTETVGIGLALISYQHGDYAEAAGRFNELPATQTLPEQAFFWANSLLFAGRYEEAIKAYGETVLALDPVWSAAYNNLGVARFNKDLLILEGHPEHGLGDFEQAIRLANAQNEAELALLAYVNKSDFHLSSESYNKALTDCEAALALNAQSALPYVCRVLHSFSFGAGGQGIPFDEIKRDLDQAEQSDHVPAKLYYLRASWYRERNEDQKAIAAYERFFESMKYRACLQNDIYYIEDAVYFVNELTR